jgi:hypothetical protein
MQGGVTGAARHNAAVFYRYTTLGHACAAGTGRRGCRDGVDGHMVVRTGRLGAVLCDV